MKKRYSRHSAMFGIVLSILFFLIVGVFTLVNGDRLFGVTEIGCGIMLSVYFVVVNKNKARDMAEYIGMVTSTSNTMANDAISRFPLPMAVLSIDGQIMWYNDKFTDMIGNHDPYAVKLSSIMPELRWSEILKAVDDINVMASYDNRHYNVVGNIIKNNAITDESGNPIYSVLLYFIDRTEIEALQDTYNSEKTDVAIITIDNYDEIFQKMDDAEYQENMSKLNAYISKWVAESKGVSKKTERDRYIVMFEHQYLKHYIRNKFDVLDKVRSIGEAIKIPITISIGIGTGGHIWENEVYARAAIDMVWGRGGDQAAIKDETQYNFYGGKTKDYEKSTRVKTRAFAVAFKDFIVHADNVIFMGHSNADFDSFGAAVGLQRAVRTLGKRPYIVCDNSQAVKKLVDAVRANPEYEGMLINNATAQELVTDKTLLVILDTHRPSMLPCPELLKRVNKIVLIDHHRRSTEFIENSSLTYHEPYASSTCEMATEILQYIDDNRKMSTFEASALYVGILMDTKNFITKTGVRTFEAASYLRRYGLNTIEVKKLFNVDKDDYIHRIEIEKSAEFFKDNMIIAVGTQEYNNIRVIASQAADSLMNINGVRAAFVIYPMDSAVYISARSYGEVNVQVIMEKLGGGGHMTVAGAQVRGFSPFEVSIRLKRAIEEYIDENTAE